MVECPTCGEDDFKNEHGMKIHHARKHGESISGVVVGCENCGDEFRQDKYRVKGSQEKHFCCNSCQHEWRSEHQTGSDAPRWKGGGVVVICEQCGGEFTAKRARVEADDRRSNVTYCTRQCANEAYKHRYAGEQNPRYKGGDFSRGVGWGYSKSLDVRRRDQARCCDCGRSEKDVVGEIGAYLHVHHICGARSSTNPAVYNAERNLVTLCVNCHRRWERHVPGVPPDIKQKHDNRRKQFVRS